jgi:hypothetical protein
VKQAAKKLPYSGRAAAPAKRKRKVTPYRPKPIDHVFEMIREMRVSVAKIQSSQARIEASLLKQDAIDDATIRDARERINVLLQEPEAIDASNARALESLGAVVEAAKRSGFA